MIPPASSPLDALLTVEDLAAILKVSRSQAYALKHKIGFVLVGARRIRFEPEAVRAYIERQRRAAPADVGPGSRRSSGPVQRATASRSVSPQVAATMQRLKRGLPATISERAAEILAKRRRGGKP